MSITVDPNEKEYYEIHKKAILDVKGPAHGIKLMSIKLPTLKEVQIHRITTGHPIHDQLVCNTCVHQFFYDIVQNAGPQV